MIPDEFCKKVCKGYKDTGKCFVDGECEAHKIHKGKPRHNPDKPANKRGKHCPEYETMGDKCWCVAHPEIDGEELKCGGDRHNCVKVDYQKQAILEEL